MKKNKENGSQTPRARATKWLNRITGTFIGKLIFEVIPPIVKPFVAAPIAILISVAQGLYKLAKAVLDLLRKDKNPEDEPIEAEDLPQPGAENSEPAPEAETDATPEGTTNATPSTADKPV